MPAPRIDNLNNYTNLFINGAMDFWQRGVSGSFTNNRPYVADRWCHTRSGGYTGSSSVARSTDVPTLAQAGFQLPYSLLVTNATGLASPGPSDFYVPYLYLMEGNDYATIHGQACRLQFWIKSSIAGTYSVAFRNNAGTRSYVTTITISAANTWEREVIDLTMDNTGTWEFGTNNGLTISIAAGCGSTFQTSTLNAWQSGNFLAANTQTNWAGTTGATIQLTGVMLVKGSFPSASTVLSFQRAGRTIGDELRMCQRYYEAWTTGATGSQNIFIIYGIGGGNALSTTYQFHTQKRGNPNITLSNITYTNCAFSSNTGGVSNFSLQVTSSAAALAQGNIAANTTWMTADAEL